MYAYVFHDTNWPNSWTNKNSEDPVVLLERNLDGDPLTGLLWWREFEEVLFKLGWENYNLGMSGHRNKDYSSR